MSPRTEKERLEDILGRIARIKVAETALLEAADDQEKAAVAFDAILYNLMVIGEAVKALGVELKARNGKTPWKDVAGMRDILTHHYFRVSGEVVMATVDKPLAELRDACKAELDL
ncbi:hypothetical protein GALL_329110 [mine drainage metagenome]|uniref:Protein containing DUF86 n=1 Tax=mine drainage metagenome TaxID=410659 RepID=A0A1J5QNU2_9ZZZZ